MGNKQSKPSSRPSNPVKARKFKGEGRALTDSSPSTTTNKSKTESSNNTSNSNATPPTRQTPDRLLGGGSSNSDSNSDSRKGSAAANAAGEAAAARFANNKNKGQLSNKLGQQQAKSDRTHRKEEAADNLRGREENLLFD